MQHSSNRNANQQSEQHHSSNWHTMQNKIVKEQELPRSMQPQIPEPRHRVGPKGVSSGLSHRILPDPSLKAILDICDHYEAKCSGKYVSLASRYVFHMSKEIRAQIDGLQQGSKNHIVGGSETGKYVQFLSNHSQKGDTLRENSCRRRQGKENIVFASTSHSSPPCNMGRNEEADRSIACSSHSSLQHSSGGVCNTPLTDPQSLANSPMQQVHDRVLKQQETIDELVLALNTARQELSKLRETGFPETSEYIELFRKGAEADRVSHQEILAEVKRLCEERVAIAQMEVVNVKGRADQEIQALQQRTDEVMASLVNMLQEEKESAKNETEEMQKIVTRDYFVRRGQLDDKIKNVEKNERVAVQRACTRLKRLHALEALASKRDHVLREMKGCASEETIVGNTLKLRDSCSDSCNHDMAGCSIKFRVKEDECACLQSQVNDLEGWVNALTTALRETNKITHGNCTAALLSDTATLRTVRKQYKPTLSKPVDESRYTYTKNIGACSSGSMFSFVAAHPPFPTSLQ